MMMGPAARNSQQQRLFPLIPPFKLLALLRGRHAHLYKLEQAHSTFIPPPSASSSGTSLEDEEVACDSTHNLTSFLFVCLSVLPLSLPFPLPSFLPFSLCCSLSLCLFFLSFSLFPFFPFLPSFHLSVL